jgi:hypothetical protein
MIPEQAAPRMEAPYRQAGGSDDGEGATVALRPLELWSGAVSHHAHQRALRLEIDREANALMNAVGPQAYWAARRRAEEASSDEMAKGWTGVAAVIERRTAKRSSLLSYLLH